MSQFKSISEFRKFAETSSHFAPTEAPAPKGRKKYNNAMSYVYRQHQVVTFFDEDGVEALEAMIVAKDYPASPTAGRLTKFNPQFLNKLDQRHKDIEDDLARAAGSFMSDGILAKPIAGGMVALFISKDVTKEMAERVLAVLRNEQ